MSANALFYFMYVFSEFVADYSRFDSRYECETKLAAIACNRRCV
jgi:hypothetical protein